MSEQAKARRWYCGCYGIAWSSGPTDPCPECDRPAEEHREIDADKCGAFVEAGSHGHPCKLAPDHAGYHESDPCGTNCHVIRST